MERIKKGHLTLEERQHIYAMHKGGRSDSEIAKIIGRHRSVVLRERRRNRPPVFVAAGLSPLEHAKYAQDKAKRRGSDCKKGKKGPLKLAAVRERIIALLKEHYSPETIAQILSQSDLWIKVSGKTIRRWIKKEAPELRQYLPQRGKPRRSRMTRRKQRQIKDQAAPKKRHIAERPTEVESRIRPGDLEADTIFCRKSKTAILSVVDRANRRRWYRKVDNLQANTVLWALIQILLEVPPTLRRTSTFDNGSEFADWHKLERLSGLCVYFCDPYCAWQKGSVEHANKEFRRFAPKGTDLSLLSEENIARIEQLLNAKPMDCLGGYSAADSWHLATSAAVLH